MIQERNGSHSSISSRSIRSRSSSDDHGEGVNLGGSSNLRSSNKTSAARKLSKVTSQTSNSISPYSHFQNVEPIKVIQESVDDDNHVATLLRQFSSNFKSTKKLLKITASSACMHPEMEELHRWEEAQKLKKFNNSQLSLSEQFVSFESSIDRLPDQTVRFTHKLHRQREIVRSPEIDVNLLDQINRNIEKENRTQELVKQHTSDRPQYLSHKFPQKISPIYLQRRVVNQLIASRVDTQHKLNNSSIKQAVSTNKHPQSSEFLEPQAKQPSTTSQDLIKKINEEVKRFSQHTLKNFKHLSSSFPIAQSIANKQEIAEILQEQSHNQKAIGAAQDKSYTHSTILNSLTNISDKESDGIDNYPDFDFNSIAVLIEEIKSIKSTIKSIKAQYNQKSVNLNKLKQEKQAIFYSQSSESNGTTLQEKQRNIEKTEAALYQEDCELQRQKQRKMIAKQKAKTKCIAKLKDSFAHARYLGDTFKYLLQLKVNLVNEPTFLQLLTSSDANNQQSLTRESIKYLQSISQLSLCLDQAQNDIKQLQDSESTAGSTNLIKSISRKSLTRKEFFDFKSKIIKTVTSTQLQVLPLGTSVTVSSDPQIQSSFNSCKELVQRLSLLPNVKILQTQKQKEIDDIKSVMQELKKDELQRLQQIFILSSQANKIKNFKQVLRSMFGERDGEEYLRVMCKAEDFHLNNQRQSRILVRGSQLGSPRSINQKQLKSISDHFSSINLKQKYQKLSQSCTDTTNIQFSNTQYPIRSIKSFAYLPDQHNTSHDDSLFDLTTQANRRSINDIPMVDNNNIHSLNYIECDSSTETSMPKIPDTVYLPIATLSLKSKRGALQARQKLTTQDSKINSLNLAKQIVQKQSSLQKFPQNLTQSHQPTALTPKLDRRFSKLIQSLLPSASSIVEVAPIKSVRFLDL